MARFIVSGSSTSLTSTMLTLMPHGSVCSSMICWSCWLISSRCDNSSSSSDWPEHRAQAGLGDLEGGPAEVLDLHDGVARVDNAEVGDGVDLDRDVVLGDRFLRRDVERHDAQVHLHHPIDDRDDEEEAGSLGADQAAQPEDHAALVLLDDLDGGAGQRQNHEKEKTDGDQSTYGSLPLPTLLWGEHESANGSTLRRAATTQAIAY